MSWSFSQTFIPQFQASCNDLASRIEAIRRTPTTAQQALAAISEELLQLKKRLLDATAFLPAFDQGQCASRLQVLEAELDSLRSSLNPKPKFSFRRNATRPSPSPAPTLRREEETNLQLPSSDSLTLTPGSSSGVELSSHSHRYLDADALPTSASPIGLSISDLDHCIVNLFTESIEISAIHIRNVKGSMLLIPIIKGSVLLYNVSSCVLVVGCHQFRMHHSDHVDVYISTTSDPIIENSINIRFAPFPEGYSTGASGPNPAKAVDDVLFRAQDFSHIKATPSPHWSILPRENRISWPQKLPRDEKEMNTIFTLPDSGSEPRVTAAQTDP